jgi:hypothetical protein
MLPFSCSGWSIKHGPRDRHKTEAGAREQDIRYQRNRALRDRDAYSKGAHTGFVISMLFPEI